MANLIEVEGFAELQNKLKTLSNDKSKKREVIAILRQVANSTVKAVRQNAPISKKPHKARGKMIQPGNLKKSIGVIVGKKGDAKNNPTVYAGPRAKGKNNGWYGHFVELGHNVYKKGFKRKRSKGANNSAGMTNTTKANAFMQRAYQQTGGRVLKESEQRMVKFIQKRIDKLSK
jgi:HK97 gp10 family phage protein